MWQSTPPLAPIHLDTNVMITYNMEEIKFLKFNNRMQQSVLPLALPLASNTPWYKYGLSSSWYICDDHILYGKDRILIYNNSMWQSTPPLAPIHLDTDVAFQVDTNVCDDHIWYGKDTR